MRTDEDALRDAYRFVRTEEDDGGGQPAWEVGLAKAYESKLFKEYALVDLSQYKKGKYGCRWRTKQEVVAGKGQASCGALGCEERAGLETFEVPFSYAEGGRERLALVKARLCAKHALQLQYKKLRAGMKEEKRKRARQQQQQQEVKQGRKRRRSEQAPETPPDPGERSAEPSGLGFEEEQPGAQSGQARQARKQAKRQRRREERAAGLLRDAGERPAADPGGTDAERRGREAVIQQEADAFLAQLR